MPDAGSTVIISTAGSYAIAMANAEAVGSFVLNAAGATINDSSGQVFSVGSSMTLTAGSFALSSGSQIQAAGAFKLSAGGTLQGNGGTDQITASSITLAGLTSVSSGILGLNGGGSIGGTLSGSGTLEMSSGSYALQRCGRHRRHAGAARQWGDARHQHGHHADGRAAADPGRHAERGQGGADLERPARDRPGRA